MLRIVSAFQDNVGELKLAAASMVGSAGYIVSEDDFQKDVIFYLTAFFLVAQIILLTPKYLAWYRDWRKRRKAAREQ